MVLNYDPILGGPKTFIPTCTHKTVQMFNSFSFQVLLPIIVQTLSPTPLQTLPPIDQLHLHVAHVTMWTVPPINALFKSSSAYFTSLQCIPRVACPQEVNFFT